MKTFSSYIKEALTLQYHDELNPVFWENDKLKPEIRNHLLYIAKFWQDFAKIPNSIIEDIILVGGNANYNYTEHSDLDIHFVIHKDQMEAAPEFVDEYLKDKKELWSKIHDVKVKGHDVELYAQDVNDPYQKDQGVYSLKNDDWLVHPNHVRVDYDTPHLLHKIDHLKHRIDDLISGGANEFSFKTLKDKIKNMRVAGLKKSGEFSYENLVFKELRNSGYLDRMNDHMDQMKDASLSLNEGIGKKVAAGVLGLAATVGTVLGAKSTANALRNYINPPVQTQPSSSETPPVVEHKIHHDDIKKLVKQDEGLKLKVYKDTNKNQYLTIGYGHNLQASGSTDSFRRAFGDQGDSLRAHVMHGGGALTNEHAEKLFEADYDEHLQRTIKLIPDLHKHPPHVQAVLVSGVYRGHVTDSPTFLKHFNSGNLHAATKEFLNRDEYRNPIIRTNARGVIIRLERDHKVLTDYAHSVQPLKESHGWQEYNWKFGENRKAAKDVLKKLRKRFNLPETLPGDE